MGQLVAADFVRVAGGSSERSVGLELNRPNNFGSVSGASAPTNDGRCGLQTCRHAEKVPQHRGIDPRQANQYGVTDVVVRHVVNFGVRSE